NGTVVSNQATATPEGFGPTVSDDPDVSGPQDPTTFVVVSQAALAFGKVVEDLSPETAALPGDRVRYTLQLQAGGDAPLGLVTVTDPISPHLTDVDASMSGGTVSGGGVSWSVGGGDGL